jgi:hypothetical protein
MAIRWIAFGVFTLLVWQGAGGPGCTEGGLNGGQQQPGNTDDGVSVGTGAIAVDPTGTYLLSQSRGSLVHARLDTGAARQLFGLGATDRVVFGGDGRSLYLTTASPSRLIAYDLPSEREIWSVATSRATHATASGLKVYPLIAVTPDDRFVVVTSPDRVSVLSTADGGEIHSVGFGREIVDVDVHPDSASILVTVQHIWREDGSPRTAIHRIQLADGSRQVLTVPNCSSELSVLPDGTRAFLAPTFCGRDPVSAIDLVRFRFHRNLPGFGPTAIAGDDTTVVAFLEPALADDALFIDGDPRPADPDQYHLMFIDADTLEFTLLPIGEALPRYALTPSGKLLLVDSDTWWDDGRMRLVDIPQRRVETMRGPDIDLDEFVITSDSRRLFVADLGLFEVDVPGREIIERALPFAPANLNITPEDDRLLVRESDDWIWVYDTAQHAPERAIWVGGAERTPSGFREAAR